MKVHAKSPLRLGLAGGGTDVSAYSDIYGGMVLNATISLFTHCEITFNENFEINFQAADFNVCEKFTCVNRLPLSGDLILHRAVYNKIVNKFNCGKPLPVNVITYSDAPPGSGVGSSSSLVVCMIAAFSELLKIPLGEYDLAQLAYEVERIDCGMAGGKQDQYAAAFGGFNFMEFGEVDRVIINPLRLRRDLINDFESRLLLYYTGRSRSSAKIIEQQIASTLIPSSDAVNAMHEIRKSAIDMKEALLRGEVENVLNILSHSWQSKKRAAHDISNEYIDDLAEIAVKAGARGLKISGAGGGGFMMIAVEPASRLSVMRALENTTGRFYSFGFVNYGVESWTWI